VSGAPVYAGVYIPQVILTSQYISVTQSLQTQQLAGMWPVPCRYYDIKGRPDEHLWVEASDKEVKKLFEMGIFCPSTIEFNCG